MKILITGIHGFVGSNLVQALKVQHTIYGLDIVSPEKEGVATTFGWQELDKIPSVDAVIHLAGKAHDTKNTALEKDYFDINVGLTQTIFDYFIKSDPQKFIFFSSVKAVADTVNGKYLTEETTPNPQTPYGKSKLAAEEYIRKQLEVREQKSEVGSQKSEVGSWSAAEIPAMRRGQKSEVGVQSSENMEETSKEVSHQSSVTGHRSPDSRFRDSDNNHPASSPDSYRGQQPATSIQQPATRNSLFLLRPCMIHGPGNKGNLNLLYRLVQKGIPWPLGAFENKRSFLSIDNLSFVINQILENDIKPGIYQVADDEPLSTNRLIELIAASQNRKSRIWKLNNTIIRGLAKSGDLLRLPINTERLKKLTESYVVSNSKLKKALGIDKMPLSSEEGMKKTLESFQDKKQIFTQ